MIKNRTQRFELVWVKNFVGISVMSCANAYGFPLYGFGACNFLFDSLTVKVMLYWWSELMETNCQSLDGEVGQNPFLSSAGVADRDEREQLPVGMEKLA